MRYDSDDEKTTDTREGPDSQPFFGPSRTLYQARRIMLFGEIDSKSAERVISQLLAMSIENDDPIYLHISSPGGHVESGDAIHDMIKYVAAPVRVIGTGWVASAGALVYLAAERENRYCLPNTRFMLHQPLGGVAGTVSDIEINAEQIIKMRERINRTIAAATGQSYERIVEDTDRDYWMAPEAARDYGIVSHIITHAHELQ